jgi:excinuclease ABC subunit A
MVNYSEEEINKLIFDDYNGKKIILLAPVVKSRKGHYRELFEQISKQGFVKVRVDGEVKDLVKGMKLDRYKNHDIEVVVDRLQVSESSEKRLSESIKTAMHQGEEVMMVMEQESDDARFFSKNLMCKDTGLSYALPEPNAFSFNSPKGACPHCNGLGHLKKVNLAKLIPDTEISINKGGIAPIGEKKDSWIFKQLEVIAERFEFKLSDPISKISKEGLEMIFHGGDERFKVNHQSIGITRSYRIDFEGIVKFIENQYKNNDAASIVRWANEYMDEVPCERCHGARLREESLHFKINDQNISELAQMDLRSLSAWFKNIHESLTKKQQIIASEIVKEISTRIQFLLDVGLEYLSLDRTSKTLSGGEAQRIRLATQIGSQLVGVLYILDEPSIGLHQRDNEKLIKSLVNLRDIGNSVVVVEHDKDMIESADHIIEIGPHAGVHGGQIVNQGTLKEILQKNTLTAAYLNGTKQLPVPTTRRKGNGKKLKLIGASGNNLKDVTVEFPLGKLICVTGVSGSGKSTLINGTLFPILNEYVYKGVKKPMPYEKITGLKNIDKVIAIDQSPIGRTPRSNPATYTGMFGEIRNLFTKTNEASIRGYKPGRFSFNVKGGRCEDCKGSGLRVIEMNFLPDVYVNCESCNGKRFNRETLEVRYKGKSISDVLNMTIEEAVPFFEHIPNIYRKIKTILDVGLGYITLGQQSTTLSGGEAQRIKLATELSKISTGNTFYILDEPTTGLHFEDISQLMKVLDDLTDKGNTVLVIEHNMDVIKMADHIIDIGMEGGKNGGELVCAGTPEQVAKHPESFTAKFLKKELL